MEQERKVYTVFRLYEFYNIKIGDMVSLGACKFSKSVKKTFTLSFNTIPFGFAVFRQKPKGNRAQRFVFVRFRSVPFRSAEYRADMGGPLPRRASSSRLGEALGRVFQKWA